MRLNKRHWLWVSLIGSMVFFGGLATWTAFGVFRQSKFFKLRRERYGMRCYFCYVFVSRKRHLLFFGEYTTFHGDDVLMVLTMLIIQSSPFFISVYVLVVGSQSRLFSKSMLRMQFDMVTNIFPDGKISRPQLGIFAFRYRENKNISPLSQHTKKSNAGCSFLYVVF